MPTPPTAHSFALLALGCLTAFVRGQSAVDWRLLPPPSAPRCSLVYDEARDRFVAVAQNDAAGELLTLEWNGKQWLRRDLDGSLPFRNNFGLAYDAVRHCTVLVGGLINQTPSADVFEYDGAAWQLRAVTGAQPAPRANMACAWSPTLQGVMVVGGSGLSDSWLWNGTTWQQLSLSGLPPLNNAQMAFHAPTQRMVLVNGDQTYTVSGAQWTLATATGLPTRLGHSMYADAQNSVVRLFGGPDANIWSWNGSFWRAEAAGPEARMYTGLAVDLAGNTILFGGQRTPGAFPDLAFGPRGDTYRFTAASGWQLLDCGGPRPGTGVRTAYDLLRDRTVVVPLSGNGDRPQVREWDGRRWQSAATTMPIERLGAALCYDLATGRTLRFGGMSMPSIGVLQLSDEQFAWDGSNWTSITVSRPTPRYDHAMACDFSRNVVVLFGGRVAGSNSSSTVAANDTWVWNGVVWHLAATSGPPPRSMHMMAHDLARGRTMLFGGQGTGQHLNDTWAWNGTSWSQRLPATAPPARILGSCVYDFLRGRVQLACGAGVGQALTDLWEFDGSTWLLRSNDVPNDPNTWSALAVHGDQMLQIAGRQNWLLSASAATADVLGSGCGSAVPPQLLPFGTPELGAAGFALEIYRGPAQQPTLLGVAAGPATNIALGGGCTLLIAAIDLERTAALDGIGRARFDLPVPANPALLGLTGTAQAAMLDPQAPLGFALTNGVALHLGR